MHVQTLLVAVVDLLNIKTWMRLRKGVAF